jgi:hypothetical protein
MTCGLNSGQWRPLYGDQSLASVEGRISVMRKRVTLGTIRA